MPASAPQGTCPAERATVGGTGNRCEDAPMTPALTNLADVPGTEPLPGFRVRRV